MPYWSKKPYPDLIVQSSLDHMQQVNAALDDELAVKQQLLEESLAGWSSSLHGSKDAAQPQQQFKKSRGGWMEKCAILVGNYFRKDWNACDELCEEYITHNVVQGIIKKHVL
mgnify:CR=1 FL=1